MKKVILLFVLLFSTVMLSFSQLKMTTNGNVGLGLGTSVPLSKLSIGTVGAANNTVSVVAPINGLISNSLGANSTIGWNYGVLGVANVGSTRHVGLSGQSFAALPKNAGKSYGVLGLAGNSTTGYNYGVYGTTYGTQYGAAIVGTTSYRLDYPITSGNYAGYFVGPVSVVGAMSAQIFTTTSDKRFKTNIAKLENSKVLDGLTQLNPVEYNMEQVYQTDLTGAKIPFFDESSQFFKKKQFGLLAQEVQQVYPDLVYSDADGYLSINYIGLVPILIESIKGLKSEIVTLNSKVSELSDGKINTDTSKDGLNIPILEQNTPNPFNAETSIGFYLPVSVANASILVYDMSGKQLKKYTIDARGKSSLIIHASEFQAGMYIYALLADNKVIDTKRMLLTQ